MQYTIMVMLPGDKQFLDDSEADNLVEATAQYIETVARYTVGFALKNDLRKEVYDTEVVIVLAEKIDGKDIIKKQCKVRFTTLNI